MVRFFAVTTTTSMEVEGVLEIWGKCKCLMLPRYIKCISYLARPNAQFIVSMRKINRQNLEGKSSDVRYISLVLFMMVLLK